MFQVKSQGVPVILAGQAQGSSFFSLLVWDPCEYAVFPSLFLRPAGLDTFKWWCPGCAYTAVVSI
jgi:hypothetical protein